MNYKLTFPCRYFLKGSEPTSTCLTRESGEHSSTSSRSSHHSLASCRLPTCCRMSATWFSGWTLFSSTWKCPTVELPDIKRTTISVQLTSTSVLATANGLQPPTHIGEEFRNFARRTTSIICMVAIGQTSKIFMLQTFPSTDSLNDLEIWFGLTLGKQSFLKHFFLLKMMLEI